MSDLWEPDEILGAMGHNPATCDPVYQSAANVLWHLQTGEPAVVDLRWSKGSYATVAVCVRNWATELEIEFQPLHNGPFVMRRSSYGLKRQPKPCSRHPRRKVWDVVSATSVDARMRFSAVSQPHLPLEER